MSNFNRIFKLWFDWDVDRNFMALGCFILFTFLCFVRNIQVFAVTHVFANFMIVVTLIIIIVEGFININENGFENGGDLVPMFNTVSYSDAIGFSVYAFEGIGIILPVQDICA